MYFLNQCDVEFSDQVRTSKQRNDPIFMNSVSKVVPKKNSTENYKCLVRCWQVPVAVCRDHKKCQPGQKTN